MAWFQPWRGQQTHSDFPEPSAVNLQEAFPNAQRISLINASLFFSPRALSCPLTLPCLQFRVFTAPFHRVEFADFWLADQLNSLVVVLMDLEYLICFYVFELQWSNSKGLLPKGDTLDYHHMYKPSLHSEDKLTCKNVINCK